MPLLAITAFALTWLYRGSTYQIFDDPLTSTVTSLIASAETIPQGDGRTIIALGKEPLDPRYQRALSGRYWQIMSPGGEISSRSLYGGPITLLPEESQFLLDRPGAQMSTSAKGPDGESLRVVARSVILPNMETPVIMAAAMDQAPARRAVQRFALLAVSIMGLLILGLFAAIILQVCIGLRPLFALRDRVADVREGRATSVEGDYPREIAPLAKELNVLISHNRDVVERARTHVSNLAHALKTPLAVLKNEADSETSALGEIVGRQTQTMTQQVEHHLTRARAAARAQSTAMRSQIERSISDMARTMVRIYSSKDLDITQDIDSALWFRGEKADLDEMIGNLVDNGCKWARGRVHILSHANMDAGFVDVVFSDDGPGIAKAQYEKALKRGERLDEAIPGTGFGLSIVDELARAYKGRLTLGSSDLGGLKVTLTLPCAQAPQ